MNKKVKTALKATGMTVWSVLGVVFLVAGVYASYVIGSYYRIEDNLELKVDSKSEIQKVETDKDLKYTSFNIGFGAYSYDYDFFLDKGVTKEGVLQTGHWSKGKSKAEVLRNVNGCIDLMKTINSDFYAVQEADTKSDRAYDINQAKMIIDEYSDYDSTFACNFHSAFLAYPFYDMHGASNAGLVTLSKYQIQKSTRYSLQISDGFDKFMDLDRCYSANFLDTDNGKQLCLVNIHMSAYDEGGKIRNKQIQQLKAFVNEQYDKGNYVICAGDYNHDLLANNPLYEGKYTNDNPAFHDQYDQQIPPWVSRMFKPGDTVSPFGEHFRVMAAEDNPSVRGVDRGYKFGTTYVNSVDGFVLSDNIIAERTDLTVHNVSSEHSEKFSYSDHQPTTITFRLKK